MRCRLVQPIATAMLPQLSRQASLGLVGVAFLIGVGLVCVPLVLRRLVKPVSEPVGSPPAPHHRSRKSFSLSTWALVALGVLILFGIAVVMTMPVGDWMTQGGQPILLEGISLWPTIFLRVVTLLLCIWLIVYSLDRLAANMRDIEQEMHLEQTRQEAEAGRLAAHAKWPFFKTLAYWLGYDPAGSKAIDASHFWQKYYDRGRIAPRLARVAVGVLFVLALWGALHSSSAIRIYLREVTWPLGPTMPSPWYCSRALSYSSFLSQTQRGFASVLLGISVQKPYSGPIRLCRNTVHGSSSRRKHLPTASISCFSRAAASALPHCCMGHSLLLP